MKAATQNHERHREALPTLVGALGSDGLDLQFKREGKVHTAAFTREVAR